MKYKRILLKLSGERLSNNGDGIDEKEVMNIATEIAECAKLGVQIAVVIGGGNMWRGREHPSMDHSIADKIGMLGTVMNALSLNDALLSLGIKSAVFSSIEMNSVCEFYNRDRAVKYLREGNVVIFGGGIGNPYFSTDTAASLRACEINANAVFKATSVDGVYSADPKLDSSAVRYDKISHLDVIEKGLKVMDTTAISLCMDNNMPVLVFSFKESGNLRRVLLGENIATIIDSE